MRSHEHWHSSETLAFISACCFMLAACKIGVVVWELGSAHHSHSSRVKPPTFIPVQGCPWLPQAPSVTHRDNHSLLEAKSYRLWCFLDRWPDSFPLRLTLMFQLTSLSRRSSAQYVWALYLWCSQDLNNFHCQITTLQVWMLCDGGVKAVLAVLI